MSKLRSSTFFWAPFDAARDHAALDGLAFLHAQPGEHVLDPLAGEDPHQVVFQREVEAAAAGIALPAAAAAELEVDAAGLVALGADDVQPAHAGHLAALGLHLLALLDLVGPGRPIRPAALPAAWDTSPAAWPRPWPRDCRRG